MCIIDIVYNTVDTLLFRLVIFFVPGVGKLENSRPKPLPPRVPKTQFMAPAAAAARPKATGNRSRNFFTPSIITRQWVFWVVLKRKKKKNPPVVYISILELIGVKPSDRNRDPGAHTSHGNC